MNSRRVGQYFTSIGSVILGATVVYGWKIKSVAITQIHPSFAAMQFNTALCFILSGLSLLLLLGRFPKASRITTGLLACLSIPTLTQYILGTDYGIDLLFNQSPLLAHATHPGRMSPTTASVFVLFCIALWLQTIQPLGKKVAVFVEYTAFAILCVGLLSLIGYVSGHNIMDSWHSYIQVAVHTGCGFCLLGAALFLESRSRSQDQSLQAMTIIVFLLVSRLLTDSKTEAILFLMLGVLTVVTHYRLQKEKEKYQKQAEESKFISDSLGVGVWKLDPRTNRLEWDKSMYALYGIDPKEFSGAYSAWENSLSTEAKEATVKELGLALSGEKDFNTTFQIKWKNGETHHIAGRGFVIRDEKNEPILMYGLNWDVTELAMAEKQLKENQQLLASVLDTMPVAVFAKDIKNNFQWILWNRQAEEVFGLKAKDCLGKSDSDFFPKEQADFFRTKDIEASKTRGIIDIPEEPANLARGKGFLHTRKTVVRDASGEASILLGITEDITDRKLQENELKQANLKLIQSSKLASLGEMSAGIAHEINNPLAIIGGSTSQLLKYANNPEKLSEKIATIEKAVGRISKIVKGLKKFSRSSENKNFGNYVLSQIVKESVILTEVKSKRNQTLVSVELKSEASIFCDEVEIEQVLVNLINNGIDAVKHLQDKWVKVELFEDGDLVVLRVRDSGLGIPEAICSKLFEPFFTTKIVGEGTGLGLSITKGILDQHKATIAVLADEPNTCFEIRFQKSNAVRAAA